VFWKNFSNNVPFASFLTNKLHGAEANYSWGSQEVSHSVRNLKVHYLIYKSSIVSQINPVHTPILCPEYPFNTILPSVSRSSKSHLSLRFCFPLPFLCFSLTFLSPISTPQHQCLYWSWVHLYICIIWAELIHTLVRKIDHEWLVVCISQYHPVLPHL